MTFGNLGRRKEQDDGNYRSVDNKMGMDTEKTMLDKTTPFLFFRHNGKRYTFKKPIPLKIIESPGPSEDDGEYFDVINEEWNMRGSDTRSLEYAIQEAEYFFQFYNGWLVTTKKKLSAETAAFQKKILDNIGSITEDDSAPWGYVE